MGDYMTVSDLLFDASRKLGRVAVNQPIRAELARYPQKWGSYIITDVIQWDGTQDHPRESVPTLQVVADKNLVIGNTGGKEARTLDGVSVGRVLEIKGALQIYKGRLQLKASEIRAMSITPRTRVTERRKEDQREHKPRVRSSQAPNVVAVVGTRTAIEDAKQSLPERREVSIKEFQISTRTVDQICKGIDEAGEYLSRQEGHGWLLLVRGGGDPGELVVFDHPEVAGKIRDLPPEITVILGIGHTSYPRTLADHVSGNLSSHSLTPSFAASKVRSLWSQHDRQVKEKKWENRLKSLRATTPEAGVPSSTREDLEILRKALSKWRWVAIVCIMVTAFLLYDKLF